MCIKLNPKLKMSSIENKLVQAFVTGSRASQLVRLHILNFQIFIFRNGIMDKMCFDVLKLTMNLICITKE